jgi:anti-sigma-K factor RskA
VTDRQEEMLALHALRTLAPEEVRLLESESRYDTRMRETLEEFEDAAAEMVRLLPGEAPPEELRAQTLARLKTHARGGVAPFASPFRLLRSPVVAWAAAAAIAVAAAGLWTHNRQLDQRVAALTQGETAAQGEVEKARSAQLDMEKQLADVNTKAAALTAELDSLKQSYAASRMQVAMMRSSLKRYEEGTALVLWNQDRQEGLLKLENMPAVQANKDYQLWVICRKCQHPVSAGVVKVSEAGVATITFKPAHPIEQVMKFALSVEAQGGVPEKSPDGPIIFASR